VALSEPTWHPAAIADAEEARNWYAERSAFAARGFLLALDQGIEAILEAPERWPSHRYGCRRYVLPNQYPFTLVYRLTTGIEIVAVAHQKRRPGYWKRRL
jgi:plasmid stabilization system protein ParE